MEINAYIVIVRFLGVGELFFAKTLLQARDYISLPGNSNDAADQAKSKKEREQARNLYSPKESVLGLYLYSFLVD